MAILGGLGAALAWAVTLLCTARATRMIGSGSVLAWVMLTGFCVVVPWAAFVGLDQTNEQGLAGFLRAGYRFRNFGPMPARVTEWNRFAKGAVYGLAIAAIAFDIPATAMDGNVERVIARLRNVTTPLPQAKPELHALAAEITPKARAGDYAQAVMDLGATVCLPRSPRCILCPWTDDCAARAAGTAESLPARAAKSVASVMVVNLR